MTNSCSLRVAAIEWFTVTLAWHIENKAIGIVVFSTMPSLDLDCTIIALDNKTLQASLGNFAYCNILETLKKYKTVGKR